MRSSRAYVRNSSGVGMTVRELRDELSAIIKNNKGHADLVVHVDIVDRKSYEEERAAERMEHTGDEFVETSIGEGTVFGVVIPTDYAFEGEKTIELGTYVRIRAVEILPDAE